MMPDTRDDSEACTCGDDEEVDGRVSIGSTAGQKEKIARPTIYYTEYV